MFRHSAPPPSSGRLKPNAMSRLRVLILAAIVIAPGLAAAANLGTVTKALRPQLRAFDDKGQPIGMVAASSLKLPAPIVAFGVGGSLGINQGGKTIFLRGLDVDTTGVRATCAPVQQAARSSGSSYAASNMGLGGAADCQRTGK